MDRHLQKLSQLPSLPTVAVRLLKVFSDPDVSISDVVYILQTDPALSGKILKAANTSQLGLKKPVSDLQRAVVLLGKKSVMALALGFSLAEASMKRGPHSQLYADFWFQSLVRGCAASTLAERFPNIDSGEAFTIGLLARIGRLALLNSDTERFVDLMLRSEVEGVPLGILEKQSEGVTSTEVSLYLFNEWKLPAHCIDAVANLEISIEDACENRGSGEVNLADLLRIASAAAEFFAGEHRGLAIAKFYELCSAVLGEAEQGANDIVDLTRQELDDHSELFSVDMSKVGSPMELLSQAMGQLSQLAVAAAMPREESKTGQNEVLEENGRLRKRVLELTHSTMTDDLTDLYNRGYMTEHLKERINLCRERKQPVGILFLDVDHFKRVNDTFGHAAGDEVLCGIAEVLKSSIREMDTVARYGGEEFVVITNPLEAAGLGALAERIRRNLETCIIDTPQAKLQVTVSIGAALGVPDDNATSYAALLLECADAAMYESKKNGRNRVTVSDDPRLGKAATIEQPVLQTT